MKKIIAVIMTVAIVATLGIVTFAEVTATDEEPTDPLPEEPQTSIGDHPEVVTEEDDGKVDALLAVVSSGAFLTTVASALGMMCACIYIFKRKFDSVTSKVDKTATAASLGKEAEDIKAEIKSEISKQVNELSDTVHAVLEKEELFFACFVIFVESAKINPIAKKEIIEYATGIKKVSGSLSKCVTNALENIKETIEAEPKIETPITDAAIAESEPTPMMLLG